ncbi:unnamed protein product [Calypogeia fissa]
MTKSTIDQMPDKMLRSTLPSRSSKNQSSRSTTDGWDPKVVGPISVSTDADSVDPADQAKLTVTPILNHAFAITGGPPPMQQLWRFRAHGPLTTRAEPTHDATTSAGRDYFRRDP